MSEDIKKKIEEIAYEIEFAEKKKKYKSYKKGFTRKYTKFKSKV
ncbi:MAG: hypothetical protein QW813_02905 [Candidatus Aenigmatarchaeota archaeon]